MPGVRSFRYVAIILSTTLILGCGDDPTEPDVDPYPTANTPEALLQSLALSYRRREPDRYAALLADDFRFLIDPETRSDKPELSEWWNRFTDSTETAKVFQSSDVVDIRIDLTFDPTAQIVDAIGRENWLNIDVGDEKLEVEIKMQPGEYEGMTLLVDGEVQQFYFRKGRSPTDTEATSPTSDRYYIVEWRDLGRAHFEQGSSSLAIQSTTWSGIKSMYKN